MTLWCHFCTTLSTSSHQEGAPYCPTSIPQTNSAEWKAADAAPPLLARVAGPNFAVTSIPCVSRGRAHRAGRPFRYNRFRDAEIYPGISSLTT